MNTQTRILPASQPCTTLGGSLVLGGKRIVRRAQLRPRMRHRVRNLRVRDVLREHDRKARVEVEVDVAVEEPRARVVRVEADRDVVPRLRRARVHYVAPDRVVVVVRGAARAADDGERMPVQVERVRGARGVRRRRHADLDCLVRWEGDHAA